MFNLSTAHNGVFSCQLFFPAACIESDEVASTAATPFAVTVSGSASAAHTLYAWLDEVFTAAREYSTMFKTPMGMIDDQ